MKDIIFKGCATAIVTPFDENNNVDYIEDKKSMEIDPDDFSDIEIDEAEQRCHLGRKSKILGCYQDVAPRYHLLGAL